MFSRRKKYTKLDFLENIEYFLEKNMSRKEYQYFPGQNREQILGNHLSVLLVTITFMMTESVLS